MKIIKKERESNFELLRIIAIFMVILSHFNVHSGLAVDNTPAPLYLITRIFSIGCISNFLFIIITGYFLIKSKPNFKKIISLILEMYFYSFLFFIIALIIRGNFSFTGEELKQTIFAFPFGPWFISMYVLFYLFTPFVNKMLLTLDKKEYQNLLILSIIVFSLLPTLAQYSPFSNLSIFLLGYIIGGYIRLYIQKINKKKMLKLLILAVVGYIGISVLAWIVAQVINMPQFMYTIPLSIAKNSSIIALALTVLIFLFFREVHIKQNKLINTVAGSVLGIYLIHENVFLINFIWKDFLYFDPSSTNPFLFILLGLTKVTIVFLACLGIDLLRRVIFKKLTPDKQ